MSRSSIVAHHDWRLKFAHISAISYGRRNYDRKGCEFTSRRRTLDGFFTFTCCKTVGVVFE